MRNYFYIKDDSIPKKVGTFIDFEGWLNRLFTKIGKAPILIPDTNIINKKYYSNFIKVVNRNYKILIPSLSILEIKDQYNRNKKNIRSKNAKVEDSNKAVRNSFSDMSEILNIKT